MVSSTDAPAGLLAYATQVLDALEFQNSASHMEAKHNPETGDICLVEVGARTHGGSGDWISIADEAVGLNQVVANVDASVSAEAFDALPNEPPAKLRASGRIKALLFHQAGVLRKVNVNAITSLPSYRGHAVYAKLGSAVAPTKDLFGWGGAVKLANADAEQLVKDYAVIEALCHSGLWTIE